MTNLTVAAIVASTPAGLAVRAADLSAGGAV
jgi:hypothetical protein